MYDMVYNSLKRKGEKMKTLKENMTEKEIVKELRSVIQDATAAIMANPGGPKAGKYAELIDKAGAELKALGYSHIKQRGKK